MISYTLLGSPKDKKNRLDRFDPSTETWLVSDLRSKLDLQKNLLQTREFLEEEAVLRASELWKKLLFRVRPSLEVTSQELLLALEQDFLRQKGFTEDLINDVSSKILDYIYQLAPLLSHPQGREMLQEWFKENKKSEEKWSKWCYWSFSVWNFFLKEGVISHLWVASLLVNELNFEKFWKRKLVVDLGAEINHVEVEILRHLGRYIDIEVIIPCPTWVGEYQTLMSAYEKLVDKDLQEILKERHGENNGEAQKSLHTSQKYLRFTTMLAEVKEIVSQTRRWIDSGVEPQKIAVVSANIDKYWPVLSQFFEQEGIRTDKETKVKAQFFKEVQRWISHFNLLLKEPESEDLETDLFASEGLPLLSFEKFKQIFSSVYEREDLKRSDSVFEKYKFKDLQKAPLNRKEFIDLAISIWPGDPKSDLLALILQDLIKECRSSISMGLEQWVDYLKKKICHREVLVQSGSPTGVKVRDLLSVDHSSFDRVFFCGMTDSQLRQREKTLISFSDVLSLAQKFGFNLHHVEKGLLEFEARWFLEAGFEQSIMMVAVSDFSGKIETPSRIWLEGVADQGGDMDKISVPSKTRWDYLQRQDSVNMSQNKDWSELQAENVFRTVDQDLGLQELDVFSPQKEQRLSASRLETYLECPFIYAIKYLFKLSDLPHLDLDMNAMTRGNLMHALFERAMQTEDIFSFSQEQLLSFIDQCRQDYEISLADERLWLSLREKYLQLLQRFLNVEKEYRVLFPKARVVSCEAEIKGYINTQTGEFSKETDDFQGQEFWPFIGSVDRIDQDDVGCTVIVDYKSSNNGLRQVHSWVEKKKLQLALYAQAVEKGLVEGLQVKEVEAALYYVSRTMDRSIGFRLEPHSGNLMSTDDRKKNKISSDEKMSLFTEINQLVVEAIEGIKKGSFSPISEDENFQIPLEWEALCRVPDKRGGSKHE